GSNGTVVSVVLKQVDDEAEVALDQVEHRPASELIVHAAEVAGHLVDAVNVLVIDPTADGAVDVPSGIDDEPVEGGLGECCASELQKDAPVHDVGLRNLDGRVDGASRGPRDLQARRS